MFANELRADYAFQTVYRSAKHEAGETQSKSSISQMATDDEIECKIQKHTQNRQTKNP